MPKNVSGLPVMDDATGEVRELTLTDLKQFRPAG